MCRSVLLVVVLVGLGVPSGLRADTLRGVVHDKNGKPISNARVDIATAAPKVGRGIFCPSCYLDCKKWTRTNDKGEFQIEGLDPLLKFRILSTFPGKLTRMTDLLDPLTDTPTIVLGDFPEYIPEERIITGRVVSTEGVPIPGAIVEPYGAKTPTRRWWGTVDAQPVVSDDEGRFQMLLNADYEAVDISVTADGYAGTRSELLKPGVKSHEIAVPVGTSVKGQITDQGVPKAGFRIAVVQTDRSASRHFIKSVLAVTDKNGRFQFDHLPASQQYAIFSPINGADPVSHPADAPPIIATKLFQCRGDGETRDLGPLELQPGLSLTGKVAMSDGAKLPEGLKLSLSRNPAWDLIEVAVDTDGRFSIAGLAPETYEVILNAKDLRIDTASQRFQMIRPNSIGIRLKQSLDDIVINLTSSTPAVDKSSVETKTKVTEDTVSSETSEVTSADRPSKRTLRPAAELTKEPTPENGPRLRVRGTVVNLNGNPIEQATIVLRATAAGSHPPLLARTTTDANGRFTLNEVPLPLRLERNITNLISGHGGAEILAYAEGYGIASEEVMSLDGETLKIRLEPEAEVRGRVTNDQGQPAPDARVKFAGLITPQGGIDLFFRGFDDSASMWIEADFSATTTEAGEFVLHHVPASARAYLSAEHPQLDSISVSVDTSPFSNTTADNKETFITVGRQKFLVARPPVRIELKQQPMIEVQIFDPAGQQVHSGYLNVIATYDTQVWEPVSNVNIIPNQPTMVPIRRPGRYAFMFIPSAGAPLSGLRLEQSITILNQNNTVEMRLPEPRWVTGRVVDSVTNQPIAGVTVRCWETGPEVANAQSNQSISGTDGVFRIPAASGKNRLMILGNYYGYLREEGGFQNDGPGSKVIDIPNDRDVEGVTLRLSPGLRIRGTLFDSQGKPLPRTVIRADQIDNPHESTAVRTDERGRFELTGLSPTSRTLVTATSEVTAARMIVPPIGKDSDEEHAMPEIRLQLSAEAQFTGRVLKDGLPVAGVKLELSCSLPGEQNRMLPFTVVKTDEQGRYTVGGLQPGDQYQFKILTSDGSMAPEWLHQSPYVQHVAADHEGMRELPDANLISTNQTLSGIVVDPNGNPVSGISVNASLKNRGMIPRRDNSPPPWVETDSRGEFLLEQLPDSSIELMAYKRNPAGGRIHFPAQVSAELNQKGIRIVLDPTLTDPLENLDP